MTSRYAPLSDNEERIAEGIVDAAFAVHSKLGPGLMESVYEVCFCHELSKRGFHGSRQVAVPIVYDGIEFEEAFRLDVLVEELVICELKAVEDLREVHLAQTLTYLKLADKRLGFLINFNISKIKHGIRRVIL